MQKIVTMNTGTGVWSKQDIKKEINIVRFYSVGQVDVHEQNEIAWENILNQSFPEVKNAFSSGIVSTFEKPFYFYLFN